MGNVSTVPLSTINAYAAHTRPVFNAAPLTTRMAIPASSAGIIIPIAYSVVLRMFATNVWYRSTLKTVSATFALI